MRGKLKYTDEDIYIREIRFRNEISIIDYFIMNTENWRKKKSWNKYYIEIILMLYKEGDTRELNKEKDNIDSGEGEAHGLWYLL